MAQNLKRSFAFSFFTALYVSLFATVGVVFFELVFFKLHLLSLVLFLVVMFVMSFLIIQMRVETLIYRRIKRLYQNVSLLADSPLDEQSVTTNMRELTQNVEKFAKSKKLEIEALKIRENYRREFIGNVSHELKTPLFTIEGYILTLLDGAVDDKERCEKYLTRAHKGVERLIYIVNDLDMITKLETGNLHLKYEAFNVVEVITSVFELFEMKAHKKQISLTFDRPYAHPIWVFGDRERIQQVITNLVVNSIKYGKSKGTTEVSIESLTSKKYIVRITDNGEGFEPKEAERLFERFFRIDKSGSRQEGGSGLGLSIVKHILEAHKEKIYVESDPGIGSEFSFTLQKTEAPKANKDERPVRG